MKIAVSACLLGENCKYNGIKVMDVADILDESGF